MIQKLEGDVRNHIRVEQQLKLHVESLTFKSEEAEKENERLQSDIARLQREKTRMDDVLTLRENEIEGLRVEAALVPQLRAQAELLEKR